MDKRKELAEYYRTCAVPKPVEKKKRKRMNGYKDKPNRYCVECGTPYAERHEIFGGANRQNSIADRLQIDLCSACHRRWHEGTDEETIAWRENWRRKAQKAYEERLIDAGAKPSLARELFRRRYGFNVLEENE